MNQRQCLVVRLPRGCPGRNTGNNRQDGEPAFRCLPDNQVGPAEIRLAGDRLYFTPDESSPDAAKLYSIHKIKRTQDAFFVPPVQVRCNAEAGIAQNSRLDSRKNRRLRHSRIFFLAIHQNRTSYRINSRLRQNSGTFKMQFFPAVQPERPFLIHKQIAAEIPEFRTEHR